MLCGAILAALAAAADSAFDEVNRVHLRERAARIPGPGASVGRLLEDPARSWTAIRLLDVIGLILATAGLSAWLIGGTTPRAALPWLAILAFALLAGLILDYLPRMLANRNPVRASLAVAPVVDLVAFFIYPGLELMARFTGYLPFAQGRSIREDELRALLNVDEENGSAIEADEIEMMAGIIELGDTKVREVMVPRIDIVAIPIEASLQEATDIVQEAGHSRIPVYRDSIDHIEGLLYAKDLLGPFRARDFDARIEGLLRPPHVVPESMLVKTLLAALRNARVHMAIVVDEYGGTAGLVTIEDLIEEIVGEIQDEYDEESPRIEHIDADEGVFSGGMDIDDVNRLMDIRLPTDAVDTLAGLVLDRLGRVPAAGEQARFTDADLEVLALEGRRIHRVRVSRRDRELGDSSDGQLGEPGADSAPATAS